MHSVWCSRKNKHLETQKSQNKGKTLNIIHRDDRQIKLLKNIIIAYIMTLG